MTSRESGRLPEEGTPKLVLKEEQGLVKAEEGSLADEMGSDAGWPGTRHRSWWEGMEERWPQPSFSPGSHGHYTDVNRKTALAWP